ncbi:MAG: hypothetical protein ACD_49C00064G0022 [uncultured bacterium (gcode 4)]|uniref:Uncharacterized protein n=1 Tax=uncultured bacterium (gcode 4) TaxID=1234023 RepID=K2BV72_9BACT|nr:MAG: hypothetical protein ACD_49C00064G0022 [uncultured bacterium (gcode 4)]
MKNSIYKNILITERDVNILKLLSKLKIWESDLIRDLLSPETSQNTFTKRLKKLEDKWFIQSINQDQRWRTQNKLYQLNTKQKRTDIETIIGNEILWWTVNMSYSNYYHSLYIGYFLKFLIWKIKSKNMNYAFIIDNFISQFEFQKWTTTRKKNNWDTVIIPDWLLKIWDKVWRIEVERLNSAKEFKNKIKKYKDQYFYLEKDKFCPFFEKNTKHSLLIMAPDMKILPYRDILDNEEIEEYYELKLINEDIILKHS